MISAVIVGDEPKNTKVIRNMLKEFCPQVSVTGEADNASSAKSVIREKRPQLVFLDIEMPYGNGFDLLNELMPVDFEIVFVTAFDKYLLQALKYSALDFLLKPVNIEELQSAVKNAEVRIEKNMINQQLRVLLDNFKKDSRLKKIAIPTTDGLDFVSISEIVRLEAMGAYTRIHINKSGSVVVSKTLKDYESLLPEDIFFRIHNSHVINLNYIQKYGRGRGGVVILEDGSVIEVATRRKEEFLRRFGFE